MTSSNEEQVRKLHEKLNVLESINPENNQKIKLTHIQDILARTIQDAYHQEQQSAMKIKETIQCLRKMEARLREQSEQTDRMEEQSKLKIARAHKVYERAIQRMTKERKDTGKKINVALEGFLVQLTSAKAKSNCASKSFIKQLSNLQMQLNVMESEIVAEENATKDITKKIYAQFSSQIEELSEMLNEQKKQRESEEEKVMNRLEKMYSRVHQRIKENSQLRKGHEQQIMHFLEKIIEKIRNELISG